MNRGNNCRVWNIFSLSEVELNELLVQYGYRPEDFTLGHTAEIMDEITLKFHKIIWEEFPYALKHVVDDVAEEHGIKAVEDETTANKEVKE